MSSIMYRPSDGFEVIIAPLYSSRRVFVKSLLWPVAVSLSPAHQGEWRESALPLQPPLLQCTDIIQLKKTKKTAPTEHAGLIEI